MRITGWMLLLPLLLGACSDNIVKKEKVNDLTELGLKGPVKSVTEYESKKDQRTNHYTVMTFNEKGNLTEKRQCSKLYRDSETCKIERYTYWENNKLKEVNKFYNEKLEKQFIYNESGQMIEERQITQNYKTGENSIQYAYLFTYDKNGNLATMQQQGEQYPSTKYICDQAGNVTNRIEMEGEKIFREVRTDYKYDKKGNIIEQCPHFNIIKDEEANDERTGLPEYKYTYKYDDNGLLTESDFFVSKANIKDPNNRNSEVSWNLTLNRHNTYTYNEHGDQLQIQTPDREPVVFRYLYDTKGNWTLCGLKSEPHNYKERKIEYFVSEEELNTILSKQDPMVNKLAGSWILTAEKIGDKEIDCSSTQCILSFSGVSSNGTECELIEKFGNNTRTSTFGFSDSKSLIMSLSVANNEMDDAYTVKEITANKLVISFADYLPDKVEHEFTFQKE